jgi:biotin operon repressor
MKEKYVPLRVRPKSATPAVAVELHKTMSLQAIADVWGISKNRVWQLIQKAQKNEKK